MSNSLSEPKAYLKDYMDNSWLIIKSPNRYIALLLGLHNVSHTEEFDSLDKARTFVERNRVNERVLYVI